jgi:hypothetical protein
MGIQSNARKQAAKQARFDEVLHNAAVRADDKQGDEHRRMAAHAHVMTHHALEMDTPEAHQAAAMAHQKVAEMHEECAEAYPDEEEEAPVKGKPAKK